MKKALFWGIICLVGCHPAAPVKSPNVSVFSDTGKKVTDVKPKIDTVALREEQFAYKNIRFGISMKKCDRLLGIDDTIGAYEYAFSPEFNHKNQLYRLRILGSPLSADFLDSKIEAEMDNLVTVVSNKYGKVDAQAKYPSVLDFEDTRLVIVYSWSIGTKGILIGVQEYDNDFQAFCLIESSPMDDEEREYDRGLERSKQKSDASKF